MDIKNYYWFYFCLKFLIQQYLFEKKKKRVDIKKKIIKFEKVFIRVFICIFNKGRNEKMFFFFDLFIVSFLSIQK